MDPLAVDAVRLYGAALGRSPDAAGLPVWAEARANGSSMQEMAEAFVRSGEFQERFGEVGDRDFVVRLYQTALDRPADPAGLDAWTAALDSGAQGRGDVVLCFALSAEMTQKITPLVADGILFA